MAWALCILQLHAYMATAMAAGTPNRPGDNDASRCGSIIGRQRAQELALGEHLLALVQQACPVDVTTKEEIACRSAAVLSRKPLIVSVPLMAADQLGVGTLLEELLAAQPSGLQREDGWHMSPKGPATTAAAAVLANTVS